MRGIVVETPGGMDRLEIKDVAEPHPAPGEVSSTWRTRRATGATFKTAGHLSRSHYLSGTSRAEVSGFVCARGKGVTRAFIRGLAAGTLLIPIAADFPIADIHRAQALLEDRSAVGKVLIKVN